MEPLYVYSFYVRPNVARFSPSLRAYRGMIAPRARVEMEFTESQFAQFREDLANDGFVLYDAERVSYREPEVVG